MQKSMYYKKLFFSLLAVALTACGPTIKISPELAESKNKLTLALAPINKSIDIRDERVELFRNIIESKLKSKGYLLLDRGIVNDICENATCSNRKKLFEQYKIGGLLSINLETPSETNWGLISYNSVSANAKLENASNQELYTSSASASKSGGLILQSGQIIRAIKDLYINSADETFLNLSSKLVDDLLEPLPEQSSSDVEGFSSMIANVNKSKISPDFYKICIEGTPNALASIVHNRERTTLREISMGKYCGSVYSSGETLNLELRSPYGFQAISKIGI